MGYEGQYVLQLYEQIIEGGSVYVPDRPTTKRMLDKMLDLFEVEYICDVIVLSQFGSRRQIDGYNYRLKGDSE